MIDRANIELKANNFSAASTSADLAKSKAEQAQIVAKPQYDSAESGRDAKAKSQEISRDAAGLPGTTVRIDRKGEVQRLVLPYSKLFSGKVTTIKPGNDDALDALAALLKKYPALPVQVVGHTDSRGKRDALLALSAARAQSVYNALLNRGIEAKRLSSSGMGGDEPVTDNKTTTGRATNNRVEVVLILQ
jgi:outer membrane protein OmpA-like peptidoglycan-associated protein